MLKSGGIIIGIHPLYALDKVKNRLEEGGFTDINVDIFDECILIFETIMDFAEHLSSSHMSKDYQLAENKEALDKLVEEHKVNNRLVLKEERFIVTAK